MEEENENLFPDNFFIDEMQEVQTPELSPPTQIAYTASEGHTVIVRGTAGFTAEDLAAGLPKGTAWREVGVAEADMLSYTKTLDQAKAEKLEEILTEANKMSASIKSRYSQLEIDSWQQQETEARSLLDNLDALAPLVRDLALNAGVSPFEFSQKIVTNADAAASATKACIIQQQTMERTVALAESIEAVQAISVSYRLG